MRPSRTLGATLAASTLLGTTLLGCTTGQPGPDAPAGLATMVTEEVEGNQALLEGIVSEIDGCFYIEGLHDEGALTIAVFPAHEVKETADGDGFTFLSGDYSDGDAIAVAGSTVGPDLYEIPEECDEDAQLWRVTPASPP